MLRTVARLLNPQTSSLKNSSLRILTWTTFIGTSKWPTALGISEFRWTMWLIRSSRPDLFSLNVTRGAMPRVRYIETGIRPSASKRLASGVRF